MNQQQRQEWLERYYSTETVPVRVWAARTHARELIVDSYTATWLSNGGVPYRKTAAQRQIDRVEVRTAVKILADYVGQGSTPDALLFALLDEAVERGELIRPEHGPPYPPHERDQAWVDTLPVRSTP